MSTMPPDGDRDGSTYNHDEDYDRLNRQMKDVFRAVADGAWHTPPELEDKTGHSWASISARLRDLRKDKYGGYIVEREYLAKGLWMYRIAGKREK